MKILWSSLRTSSSLVTRTKIRHKQQLSFWSFKPVVVGSSPTLAARPRLGSSIGRARISVSCIYSSLAQLGEQRSVLDWCKVTCLTLDIFD